MKTANIIIYFILFFELTSATAQEVNTPPSVKRVPQSKCYWSYGVRRVSSKDSLHNYVVSISLEEHYDDKMFKQLKKKSRPLKIKGASIHCSYIEKGISRKIYFKPSGLLWVARFSIHTNQPLPVNIVANYYHQEIIMPFTLNKGVYPGEYP